MRPVLQWVFRRNRDELTCALDMDAHHAYRVRIVPHWDSRAAIVEQIDSPHMALLRHAEVAQHLRDNGWSLAEYAGDPRDAAS